MAWLRTIIAGALLLGTIFVPATATKSADLIKVKVATLASDTGADVFYAREAGFFTKAGLDVQVDTLGTGAAVISAVTSGTYDFGAANPVSIAQARIHGLPLLIVAPGAIHVKGIEDDGLMIPAASTIKSAKDLEGKTIAVTTVGGLGALALQTWIARSGADVKAVKLTEIPFSTMGAALEQGRIDAALMTEPFITAVKPKERYFIDGYDAIADHFLVDGWVSTESYLAKNTDTAKKFVAALKAAHAWANSHHPETAAILVKNAKVNPSLASSMARAQFGDALLPSLIQPVIDVTVKSGQLDHAIPASELIWKAP